MSDKPKRPRIVPMGDVVAWLAANQPQLVYESERNWIWITSELGPLHKKCQCEECEKRKAVRSALVEFDGVRGGFIFASGGHACPSGAVGHWAHHCEHPIKFKRRDKGGSEADGNTKPPVDDDALLAQLLRG